MKRVVYNHVEMDTSRMTQLAVNAKLTVQVALIQPNALNVWLEKFCKEPTAKMLVMIIISPKMVFALNAQLAVEFAIVRKYVLLVLMDI